MTTLKDPSIFGYQNFYSTTLTADITSSALTISLATVPTPTSGVLVIDPDSTTGREVILYTSKGASTITCPSDGRGWASSTASAHLTGTTVIMAPVDEFFKGLASGELTTDPLRTSKYLIADFVASGGVVAISSGLIGTFSNIVAYINGIRYSATGIANKTYTASKDTYVDATFASGGAITVAYNEVANGATAPALSANYIRLAKVVTSGAAITSVTTAGTDGIGNPIRNTAPVRQSTLYADVAFKAYRTAAFNLTAAQTKIVFDTKDFDTAAAFNNTTGIFTAPYDGTYHFDGTARTSQSSGGHRVVTFLVLNGSTTIAIGTDGSGVAGTLFFNGSAVSDTVRLTAGDTVEVQVLADATIAADVSTPKAYCRFSGHLVGR